LALPGANYLLSLGKNSGQESDVGDLEWLLNQEVAFESIDLEHPEWLFGDPTENPEIQSAVAGLDRTWSDLQQMIDVVEFRRDRFSDVRTDVTKSAQAARLRLLVGDYYARLSSIALRQTHSGEHVIPITRVLASFETHTPATAAADVVNIVLKQFPMPSDEHSLEDIFEFREWARGENLPQGLRVWMSEVAKAQLTAREIEDKLEYLIGEYARGIRIHRMRESQNLLQTLLLSTAEVGEHLVRGEFRQAIEPFLGVQTRKAELLKQEMMLPGREVAYIVKARERFGLS
jgi:hypothetical protein